MKSHRGFSLVELMAAMAIMAILFAIVIPSYSEYATKTRRADGKQMVMSLMQAEERFFSNNLTYTLALKDDLGYSTATAAKVPSTDGFYLLTVAACASSTIAQCVVITAAAQGKQAGDGNFSLNSRGTTTGNW